MLAQQVFFAQRDFQVGAGQRFSMDAWDGYIGSRDRTKPGCSWACEPAAEPRG